MALPDGPVTPFGIIAETGRRGEELFKVFDTFEHNNDNI
jgi:hypothetical protein